MPVCTTSYGINPQPRRDVQFKYLRMPLKVCNLLHQMCRSWKIKWSHCETSVSCFVGLMAVSFQWIQWRDWDDKNIYRSAHERRNSNSVFYLRGKNQIAGRCCYNTHRYCRNVADRSLQQHSVRNPKNWPWLRIKFLSPLHLFLSSVSKIKATTVTSRNTNTKTRK